MCKPVSSSSVHGTDMSLHRRLDEQTVLVTAVIVVVNILLRHIFCFHLISPQCVVLPCTTTSLYTDCRSNLYAGLPSYLLILFSALSAFAVVG